MISRALLLCLTAFWVTMNVLLWRAEYGAQSGLGTRLPPRVVWDKVLNSLDSSSLTLFHNGKRIGFCHWVTSVGEDLSRMSSANSAPEGMVDKIVGYRIGLDGNIAVDESAERLRFDSHLTLGPDRQWRSFDLRVNLRPASWEIHASAASQTLKLNWEDESGKFERVFKFSDLQNPQAIARELGNPFLAGALGGLGLAGAEPGQVLPRLGLAWDARNQSIRLGHSSVRAYRLQARLLDQYSVVVFVSLAGELLRVELPGGLTLTNDQLGGN